MATTFTLDDIREAAEAKYGSTDIAFGADMVLVMRNALRLSKSERAELANIQELLDEDGADQEQILADAIVLVAQDKSVAKKFLKEINEDLAILAEVFGKYTGETQVGEASASQD